MDFSIAYHEAVKEIDTLRALVLRMGEALETISALKNEAYERVPVSPETTDIVARHAGRIAKTALADPAYRDVKEGKR